jgi:hypothetical protein
MTQKHPNSKKVTIFRAGSFINDAQTQAQEFMSMSKKTIGSYFAGSNKKGIGNGLNFDEIDILLPRVLDIPKEDRTFREAVRKFYTTIATRIPHGTGLDLEIGLLKSNAEPVSETNLPIDIDDYLRYRHAIAHPRVALSKEAALGNVLIEFYVFDREASIKKQTETGQEKDKALMFYLGLKEDSDKVNAMLVLLGVDPREFTGKNATELREQRLRTFADSDAHRFITVYESDNFEQRYLIQALVFNKILRQIGTQYIDVETNKIVAHSLDEAIFMLQDPKESQYVVILKQKLQESYKDLAGVKKKPTKKKEVEPVAETTPASEE